MDLTKTELEGLFELLKRSIRCSTETEYNQMIESMKEFVPFDYFTSGLVFYTKSQIVDIQATSLAEGLETWENTYFEEALYDHDPILKEYFCQTRNKHIRLQWWQDTYQQHPESKKFVETARRCGVVDGYTHGQFLTVVHGAIFSFFGPKMSKDPKIEEIITVSIPFLSAALQRVPKGRLKKLTTNELEIFNLVSKTHLTYDDIAYMTGRSKHTVDQTMRKARQKLGVESRLDYLRYC